VISCGEDTVVDPLFGDGCTKGSISPGDTILGQLTPSSCFMEFDFYSFEHAPYEAFDVKLTAGHAYMFRLDSLPDTTYADFDARLTLWTKNEDGSSIPLAAADDEAGNRNSVMWFVAPVSGSFKLVASSYWYGGLGNYRLIMHECPVIATLDTAGTYTLEAGLSYCTVPRAGGSTADTSRYSFVRLSAAAGDSISATISTAAFPLVWEMFGTGFDYAANIYDDSRSDGAKGTGTSDGFTLGEVGGQITIALGATTADSADGGVFTLQLGRVPASAPPALARIWSINELGSMAVKPRPAKQP
jgi:hypothetical protein